MKRPGACRIRPATALRRASAAALAFLLAATLSPLAGCDGFDGGTVSGSSGPGTTAGETAEGSTSGPAFERPELAVAQFDADAATSSHDSLIDVSHASQGYVAASAQNASRLKFLVEKDGMKYHYDLPGDGTPVVAPLNLGDGAYEVQVMQNTEGDRYASINAIAVDVALDTEFEPFLRPNVFCDYDANSACVAKANELASGAQNEGDVLRAVYTWIADNVRYDTEKAEHLADATGYVPDPDATLDECAGICFDYVSLGAAMLRSQGIPTKIVTGYVSPDNIYHAWNLVYLDGSWRSVQVSVEAGSWTRIDLTFAAAGGSERYVGDATEYTDRFIY